jgi:hypothetical protein
VDTFSSTFGGESRIAAAFQPEVAGDIVGTEGETIKADPAMKPTSAQRVSVSRHRHPQRYQVASFAVYPFGVERGTLKRAASVELQIDTRPLNTRRYAAYPPPRRLARKREGTHRVPGDQPG